MRVAIIGAGASGMMAAITAMENGHTVYLFERQTRAGKKLLSTGNGRCNLSNLNAGVDHYHGADPDFVLPALTAFSVRDTLDFFASLGLITVSESDGKVYPFSDQAGSVVDVLRFAVEEGGAVLKFGAHVTKIERSGNGFKVITSEESLYFDKVIISCGGAAGEKVGGTKSGYELLKLLGHTGTKLYPSLTQIRTDNTYVKSLKGVRADAEVMLYKYGTLIAHSFGEIQFTDFGVSGPEIFTLSRYASTESGGLKLVLDLMRVKGEDELFKIISAKVKSFPSLTLENLLVGTLHNRLGRTVLRYSGYDLNYPVTSLNDDDIIKIVRGIKYFTLEVTGVNGFDSAQVTAGGIRTSEFDPETLQSRIVPGLYATGEVLDIDGDCGGYNLQWAWSSGRMAGRLK